MDGKDLREGIAANVLTKTLPLPGAFRRSHRGLTTQGLCRFAVRTGFSELRQGHKGISRRDRDILLHGFLLVTVAGAESTRWNLWR